MLSIVIFYIFFCLTPVHGQTLSNTKQLYTDVFSDLQKEVIPASDQSQPLVVYVRFYVITLARFEETQETIVLLGAIQMTWMDGGITWNPASYGNKDRIALLDRNIWTPSLTLINSVDVLGPVGDDINFNANIYHNGTVTTIKGGVLSAKCKTDISKFPFDSQTCSLQFTPWNFFANDIILYTETVSPVDLSFFSENSDWSLQSRSARTWIWGGYSMYEVTLTIKRQSLYYSIMVVCPTLLFSLINPLVFLLPVESGERIGFAMTILLSYAIFLTLVSAAIPASSNPMCIMLIIMVMTIMISGVIVVMTIGISVLYYRDEEIKINVFWRCFGTRRSCKKRSNAVKSLSADGKIEYPDSVSWRDVTDGLDRFCMVISYAVIIVITLIFAVIVT